MKYLVIIEKADNNYSAYLPDVSGCIATGNTLAEVKDALSRALDKHLRGLIEDGIEVPHPVAVADYVSYGEEKVT